MKDDHSHKTVPQMLSDQEIAIIKAQAFFLIRRANEMRIPFLMVFGISGHPDLSASGGLDCGINAEKLKKTVEEHFRALEDPGQTEAMKSEAERALKIRQNEKRGQN